MIAHEALHGAGKEFIALCIGDYTKTLQERILDMGPHYGNFHVWQEKIKRAFDPKDASDRSNYGADLLSKGLV